MLLHEEAGFLAQKYFFWALLCTKFYFLSHSITLRARWLSWNLRDSFRWGAGLNLNRNLVLLTKTSFFSKNGMVPNNRRCPWSIHSVGRCFPCFNLFWSTPQLGIKLESPASLSCQATHISTFFFSNSALEHLPVPYSPLILVQKNQSILILIFSSCD